MAIATPKKAVRESNVELLRIVLILMIIGYHLLVHGANLGGPVENYKITDTTTLFYVLLKCFLVIGVNCFVFISGFYRIKFRVQTVLSLLLQVLFYSLIIALLADIFSLREVSIRAYVYTLFTLFSGMWWFITAYLALYLLSPLLNSAIDSFSRPMFLFALIGMTLINCFSGFFFDATAVSVYGGYSLISFVHIYLIAQYISRYANLHRAAKYALPLYIGSSLLLFLLAGVSIFFISDTGIIKTFDYNNPLVILSAIAFFFSFKQLHIQSKWINGASAHVLGVYLFHDHPVMREYLVENLFTISLQVPAYAHFLSLLLFVFLLFFTGLGIDIIRDRLLTPVVVYLVKRFDLQRIDMMLVPHPIDKTVYSMRD